MAVEPTVKITLELNAFQLDVLQNALFAYASITERNIKTAREQKRDENLVEIWQRQITLVDALDEEITKQRDASIATTSRQP